MVKYLGIDYGAKNVGLAISDEEGRMAFPLMVLDNNPELIEKIALIIKEEEIGKVILGESVNFEGKPNKIMKKILPFKKKLEEKIRQSVYFEKELFTSAEANKIQGENLRNIRKGNRKSEKVNLKKDDASAAALILRSYLDKI